MRRLPRNSYEAKEEIWARLEDRVKRAREAIIEPARERLEREVELRVESIDLWQDGELLRADRPSTLDVFIAGFSDGVIESFAQRLRGLGLTCGGRDNNQEALAVLQVHPARVLVWNADNPSPGSFFRLALALQPTLKGIAVGNPRNRVVFERMMRMKAAAFVPPTSAVQTPGISPLERCVLTTLARRGRVCPNFESGNPCRSECASFEDPPRLSQLKRFDD